MNTGDPKENQNKLGAPPEDLAAREPRPCILRRDNGPTRTSARALNAQQRARAVKIAIAASLLACTIELTLGWLLGLESLIAEGIHTLLDALASAIVLLAVYVAAKPADRSHQFGHGKYEALGATIEASFVLAAAIGIAYQAFATLLRGETPEQIPLYVCVVMVATAVFYLLVSMYLMREARRTQSPAILAEAWHLRTHIYITAGLAGGLLIGVLGNWPVADTILALGVAACLLGISLHIFRAVFRQFTDAALPADEIEALGKIIGRYSDRFIEVHGLRTRQAGVERHIEMHLVVLANTTVAEAHTLSHEIEAAIAEQWSSARTTIHIEPVEVDGGGPSTGAKDHPKVRTEDASPDEREFIH